jgi:hypothetical protein
MPDMGDAMVQSVMRVMMTGRVMSAWRAAKSRDIARAITQIGKARL